MPPAAVVTAPVELTMRMRLLLVSATYSVPEESIARPKGVLKAAAVPWPSVQAAEPLPASVVTAPEAVILRMR